MFIKYRNLARDSDGKRSPLPRFFLWRNQRHKYAIRITNITEDGIVG